ncbi:hypothetical protein [Chitinivorax sp. B]|nr:hypothetical protein [Chitinivorax sp. B]
MSRCNVTPEFKHEGVSLTVQQDAPAKQAGRQRDLTLGYYNDELVD